MEALEPLPYHWLSVFLLVVARVFGLIVVAFPWNVVTLLRTRLAIAGALALMIVPTQTASLLEPLNPGSDLLLVVRELVIGAWLGLGVASLFAGVQFAGQWIGQQAGWQLGELLGSSSEETSPLGQFYGLFALTLFFVLGGHRLATNSLMETFREMPIGALDLPRTLLEDATTLVGQAFQVALQVGAPLVFALILSHVGLDIVNRTLPQIHLFALGLPVKVVIALTAIALSLAGVARIMDEPSAALLDPLDRSLGR